MTRLSYLAAQPSLEPSPLQEFTLFLCPTDNVSQETGRWETKHFIRMSLLPLSFWPQCDGCYSGAGGLGVGRLLARLWVGGPVGVLPPWGVIAVAAPWPRGPNLHL